MLTPVHIYRYIFWNYADIDDYLKFPSQAVEAGEYIPVFKEGFSDISIKLHENFNPDKAYNNFESFLEDKKTVAFMVIQHDTVKYEKYFDGYYDSSVFSSFSVAKVFISALTGIAISEGNINDVNQVVTDYLDGFRHKGYEKITLEHLLNMRSGIAFSESYNSPFGTMARFYYGDNLKKYTYDLKIKEPPGLHYDYVSCNPQIMALILEKATGMSLPEYLQKKIWEPAGMEYDASWNLDSEKHKTVKAFCCLNGKARDFARFGRLYLNKGKIGDRQVIPEDWVIRSTSIMNSSRDSQGYPYTYFWRVLENGSIFAKGILGQYLYVNREKNLIILRFGTGYGDIDWVQVFEKIADQLS